MKPGDQERIEKTIKMATQQQSTQQEAVGKHHNACTKEYTKIRTALRASTRRQQHHRSRKWHASGH